VSIATLVVAIAAVGLSAWAIILSWAQSPRPVWKDESEIRESPSGPGWVPGGLWIATIVNRRHGPAHNVVGRLIALDGSHSVIWNFPKIDNGDMIQANINVATTRRIDLTWRQPPFIGRTHRASYFPKNAVDEAVPPLKPNF
jgi:hypothetical protein